MKTEILSSEESRENHPFGINSLILKILAALLMTLDHIGMLFFTRGSGREIETIYYVLRSVGKISFPVFAFLAVEGIYHTKDAKKYLLRLLICALLMDLFGYLFSWIKHIPIRSNALIGNAFTDMFLGVLLIYCLRQKGWYKLFALLPFAIGILTQVPISTSYGTLFKADWGFFSIVLFLTLFLAHELSDRYLIKKANKEGLEEDSFLLLEGIRTRRDAEAIAFLFTELCFYLIYRMDNTSMLLPKEFVPLGTYSTLGITLILLYNGKKGYRSRVVQYSFYAYYPLHLLVLGIISLFFGVLKGYFA